MSGAPGALSLSYPRISEGRGIAPRDLSGIHAPDAFSLRTQYLRSSHWAGIRRA